MHLNGSYIETLRRQKASYQTKLRDSKLALQKQQRQGVFEEQVGMPGGGAAVAPTAPDAGLVAPHAHVHGRLPADEEQASLQGAAAEGMAPAALLGARTAEGEGLQGPLQGGPASTAAFLFEPQIEPPMPDFPEPFSSEPFIPGGAHQAQSSHGAAASARPRLFQQQQQQPAQQQQPQQHPAGAHAHTQAGAASVLEPLEDQASLGALEALDEEPSYAALLDLEADMVQGLPQGSHAAPLSTLEGQALAAQEGQQAQGPGRSRKGGAGASQAGNSGVAAAAAAAAAAAKAAPRRIQGAPGSGLVPGPVTLPKVVLHPLNQFKHKKPQRLRVSGGAAGAAGEGGAEAEAGAGGRQVPERLRSISMKDVVRHMGGDPQLAKHLQALSLEQLVEQVGRKAVW